MISCEGISSPEYHDGHRCFASERNGVAYRMDGQTGEIVHQQRLSLAPGKIYASPVLADGKGLYGK